MYGLYVQREIKFFSRAFFKFFPSRKYNKWCIYANKTTLGLRKNNIIKSESSWQIYSNIKQ